MKTLDYDYHLPEDRIAQEPVRPRDHSRLLVVNKETGTRTHRRFFEIADELRTGDLLIVNESKVFNARLRATAGGKEIEIFLLRPEGEKWIALAKPARKLATGTEVTFEDMSRATVQDKREDGTIVLNFHRTPEEVLAWTDAHGSVPVPPYVAHAPSDAADYQTVYAKTTGSVAAPTAGFHFTPELIEKLKSQGVRFATVTLHVGLGTFRPMKTETLEEHEMHEEWVDVPEETRRAIAETRGGGGRVIAVGTTTVRALESGIEHGFTKLFITPGFRFRAIDGLITNFHLPKSTLLVLVSSLLSDSKADTDWGRRTLLSTYEEAIAQGYRFYSFGDAMAILPASSPAAAESAA